ncbi:MAG: alkaline phosphatase [Lewinellaceae bacterium]|nr:alkaline phosphatase [Lewinellaceae bacterium]
MKYLLLLLLGLLPAPKAASPVTPVPTHPKNIILLIGDGMGLTQISAAVYPGGEPRKLNLQAFPVTGLVKTHSYNKLITDSAAAATAFGCGCKTKNGVIGLNHKMQPCTSVLELAKAQGLATGLVVNSHITDATPAAFLAHVPERGMMEDIAAYFATNSLDCLIGGGQKYFEQRADGQNLYQKMEDSGWQMSGYKTTSLQNTTPNPAHPFAWFSAWEKPGTILDGREYLLEATTKATSFLQKRSEKGFFLMVEGSQIDWACHQKNAEWALREIQEFDQVVGAALEFARRDGNTLVIVTADHETGGMSLVQSNKGDKVDVEFNTGSHTATLVPLYAFGPGAEAFNGVYDNTKIYQKMREALQLQDVQPVKN